MSPTISSSYIYQCNLSQDFIRSEQIWIQYNVHKWAFGKFSSRILSHTHTHTHTLREGKANKMVASDTHCERALIVIPLTLLGWNPQRYTLTPLWRTAELPGTNTHTHTYIRSGDQRRIKGEEPGRQDGKKDKRVSKSIRVSEGEEDIRDDDTHLQNNIK